MDRRELTAASVAGVYLAACVWALWSRLEAILLLAAASPLAAGFMFPKGASIFTKMLLGAIIDSLLAGLAIVPVMGDLVDLGASVVAIVLLITRFRQFASSLPGGLACLLLYTFLWFEAGLLPRQFSVTGIHHAFWLYLIVIIIGILAGGIILAALTVILGLFYDRDRTKAVFCIIGFPWYLMTFSLTILLPNRQVEHAHQAAELARRSR